MITFLCYVFALMITSSLQSNYGYSGYNLSPNLALNNFYYYYPERNYQNVFSTIDNYNNDYAYTGYIPSYQLSPIYNTYPLINPHPTVAPPLWSGKKPTGLVGGKRITTIGSVWPPRREWGSNIPPVIAATPKPPIERCRCKPPEGIGSETDMKTKTTTTTEKPDITTATDVKDSESDDEMNDNKDEE
ncbi:uncharacterized protein LOC128955613 [Oppia nitens]|uniref:uncharacterized protein LOC128955613 n=1 Tax=Oppia nitens TaxID=1686743 RepID=UPI0023DA5200|nr:uncharacterized protein LOC128955613 [Oppia nitens]